MTGWMAAFLVVWIGLWFLAWRLWRFKEAEERERTDQALEEVSRLLSIVQPSEKANERLDAETKRLQGLTKHLQSENNRLRHQTKQLGTSAQEIEDENKRNRVEAKRLVGLDSELQSERARLALVENQLQEQEHRLQSETQKVKKTAARQLTEKAQLENETARLQSKEDVLANEQTRLQTIDARLRVEAERQMVEQERLQAEDHRLRIAAARQAYVELAFAMTILEGSEEYLAASDAAAWQGKHASALDRTRLAEIEQHLPASEIQQAQQWHWMLGDLPDTVRTLNQQFIERRLLQERSAFDRVETHPLTERQRQAIVTAEDTTLVVAGAGTGKTSTIVGRVDYLVRRGLAQPDQVLVLAYNTTAAAELRDRLDRLGVTAGATISTFHALGMQVIGESTGKKPSLSPLAEDSKARERFIRDRLAEMLADSNRRKALVSFFAQHTFDETPIDPATSTTLEAVRAELKRDRRALNGKLMRSGQEVKIANWLILNGVAWDYERPYPFDTATPKYKQYQPDFYLPDYDLYLEHFGIDRNGITAPQIDAKKYRESMRWKQQLHKHHGTRLVETYSYFDDEEGLAYHLERILLDAGVQTRSLTDDEINELLTQANSPISNFISRIDQFLALFQGSGADRNRIETLELSPRDRVFLDIFRPIYDAYRAELAKHRQIDFDDMLNLARGHIQATNFRSDYTHIIIDEFQDISLNRLGLVLDLRNQQWCRLFFVGDDWQSIYRFAGSDIGVITHLAECVGATERVDLDTAFRYPQELLDLSTKFITRNPAQLTKRLTSHLGTSGDIPVAIMLEPKNPPQGAERNGGGQSHGWQAILDDIVRRAASKPATVLILGRYNHCKPSNLAEIKRRLTRHQITSVDYLTAHRAKGKEADFVVVVDVKSGEYGFPSSISDDSVLRLVLSADGEAYPHAEERRLFYVAMTRARRRLYVIAPEDTPSLFLRDELLTESYQDVVETIGYVSERHLCPRCQDRSIRWVEQKNGGFWGCANWPICEGSIDACGICKIGVVIRQTDGNGDALLRCTHCQALETACPRCQDGYLVTISGKNGLFERCSTWDRGMGCSYKANKTTVLRPTTTINWRATQRRSTSADRRPHDGPFMTELQTPYVAAPDADAEPVAITSFQPIPSDPG